MEARNSEVQGNLDMSVTNLRSGFELRWELIAFTGYTGHGMHCPTSECVSLQHTGQCVYEASDQYCLCNAAYVTSASAVLLSDAMHAEYTWGESTWWHSACPKTHAAAVQSTSGALPAEFESELEVNFL